MRVNQEIKIFVASMAKFLLIIVRSSSSSSFDVVFFGINKYIFCGVTIVDNNNHNN